jgi:hypothetical protein
MLSTLVYKEEVRDETITLCSHNSLVVVPSVTPFVDVLPIYAHAGAIIPKFPDDVMTLRPPEEAAMPR